MPLGGTHPVWLASSVSAPSSDTERAVRCLDSFSRTRTRWLSLTLRNGTLFRRALWPRCRPAKMLPGALPLRLRRSRRRTARS